MHERCFSWAITCRDITSIRKTPQLSYRWPEDVRPWWGSSTTLTFFPNNALLATVRRKDDGVGCFQSEAVSLVLTCAALILRHLSFSSGQQYGHGAMEQRGKRPCPVVMICIGLGFTAEQLQWWNRKREHFGWWGQINEHFGTWGQTMVCCC